MITLDAFDIRLLALLQRDAGLTNQEIGARIALSASQVSRRRARLEADGVIRRVRAELSKDALGLQVTAFVGVTLNAHSRANSRRFRDLVKAMESVQEAHALTGEMDYLIKITVTDLKTLARVINDDLLAHDAVQNVHSSVVLETLRDDNQLPIGG
ncbi:AsnC family transcriptional regulator [Breoghania corrubedonensis]|uniref:AsnC family transcriptional regulator n=1 Tax=Breoghania corrubedonensis TaxID=665038 RepID=A0A2T5V6P1_9HYPH|nr:Lrp/AsnC family transcriptional regulator [Breoghania corrubedonensis]PTW59417.1 AsnC family transcriptional regulator [Breoghania corrubedonensis]